VTPDGDDNQPRAVPAAEHGRTQYFDDDPDVASDPVTIDVTLPDTAFTLQTDRGVFARGRLDDGTSLLLRTELPLASDGNVLDVGCGAGPIALAMARRSPDAVVWAIDVNERARSLCARNADRNRISNIRVCAPDDVPADLEFETIWSNPPIRIGKGELHTLLLRWLTRLTPSGTASLVVQKHLGADSLQKWLIGQGLPTERIASKTGYRVLLTLRSTGRR
jgi:16S rRNA (guanine1207-N2)-methyltransferase